MSSLAAWAGQGSSSPTTASNGNSAWAQRYAQELRGTVLRYAGQQPRQVQRQLGPSEIGHACDRQVIGKMARALSANPDSVAPAANHMSDPWASIMGTAMHSWLELAFTWDAEHGPVPGRWATERRVTPDPGAERPHPGTADLYDAVTFSVVDWKGQSEGVREKLRREGPPRHYFVQILLYALGYMHAGYRVDRVVIASMPRTKSSMDDMYVWAKNITTEDLQLVSDVLEQTALREQIAVHVAAGELDVLRDIPATPDDNVCHYCPLYRSEAARNPELRGCPGTLLLKGPG